MTDSVTFDAAWRDHRAYLVNVCYQMLGDVGAAEDIAQEAFVRLAHASPVDDARAWLTVVAGRLCLDQLRSARVRREQYGDAVVLDGVSREPDPADRVTLDDEVSAALWEVLRLLTAAERVVFVLHDVFAMPFDRIAETVGRPAGACRQLARRARAKFAAAPTRSIAVDGSEHRALTEKFIEACDGGDLAALTALLDPAVWGVGSIAATSAPPPQVNRGPAEVAVNLLRYLGPGTTLVAAVTGEPVLLASHHRQVFAVVRLTVRDGRILTITASIDPAARFSPPSPGAAQ